MPDKQPRQTTTSSNETTELDKDDNVQDFGSNSEQQQSLDGSSEELSHADKVAAIVARMGTDIGKNPLREEYMETVQGLTKEAEVLRGQGKDDETIARTLHQRRIDIGKEYKALTPGPLREFILEVNLERYDNEYGPSIEHLLDKYDGDWNTIIEKSASPNMNIDGLLAGFKTWLLDKPPAYVDKAFAAWGS